ncbi:hypothetical protein PMAYCL1PPCAC_22193, partial [Pristionchus mayeri]
ASAMNALTMSSRFILLLLLVVSTAASLKCIMGAGFGDGTGAFEEGNCVAGAQYCYTEDRTTDGIRIIGKSCAVPSFEHGMGSCQSVGCTKVPGGTTCCCKGDLCNA